MNLQEHIFRINELMNTGDSAVCKTCNARTITNIKTLDPNLQRLAGNFIDTVYNKLKISLTITDAFRTKEQQDTLYAQGRTKPGKIVTNLKGGESKHNFGKSFDVYMNKSDGSVDLKTPITPQIANIAKQMGLKWGGDWQNFKDYPHFELPTSA
jgi:peptidoglycan L-alanyl-D-glutamate endopeptidase CwlK